MVPSDPAGTPASPFPRLLLSLASAASHHVPFLRIPGPQSSEPSTLGGSGVHALARRDIHDADHRAEFIIYSCLIPILVLLSGLFAGLTLGYMSLDETQLNVLSVSGTP